MKHQSHLFAKVRDLTIFYRIFHDNKEMKAIDPTLKTLIVLHGGIGIVDHQLEVDAWKKFSTLLQVIFVDQRGSGRTEGGTDESWSLHECGEDLYEFCRVMKIKKPILAGISAGGFVIMDCVIHHADLPEAIILCNTEAKKSDAARKAMFLKLGSAQAVHAVSEFDEDPTSMEKFAEVIKYCVPLFSKKPFALLPAFKQNIPVWQKQALEWSTTMDYREGLKQHLQCPVLYLAGVDDPNHPLESSLETAKFIPEQFNYFHAIPNAGAPVYQDAPEVFEQLVMNFIKKFI